MKLRNKSSYLSVTKSNVTTDSSSSDSDSDSDLYELAARVGNSIRAELQTETQMKPHQSKPNSVSATSSQLFVIDTTAQSPSTSQDNEVMEVESSDEGEEDEELLKKLNSKKKPDKYTLASSLDVGMDEGDLYLNTDAYKNPAASLKASLSSAGEREKKLMAKSVVTPDFEKRHQISTYEESLNQIRKKRKEEKQKTKGQGWFGMKAQEMTEEKKNDLTVLQMRRALDPKHFFKTPDIRALPKFFQIGKVKEGPADFYSSRIPKKQQKSSLVEELLADAEFRKYNKKKYAEIVEAKKYKKGPYQHMKRLKKRKK